MINTINNRLFFLLLLILGVLSSCNDKKSSFSNSNNTIKKDSTKVITIEKDENKGRDIWQKPETVISLLGNLEGKTVADIGAGTGYFTFRIALKADKVVAIDIEDSYLDVLDNLKQKLPHELQSKIETRLAKEDDPLLKEQEADIILIINTFSLISNKIKYLKTIKSGIKDGGKIFIVDFKMKNLAIAAPEKKDRLPMFELEELLDKAGYINILSNDTTLDYQYIVVAEKKNK